MVKNDNPSVNLIQSKEIRDWQNVDLSRTKSKWIKTEDGITQNKITGDKKAASGSLLIFKDFSDKAYEFNTTAHLGSQYQTGVVFNFEDKKNFYLFYVNRFSPSFKGFWVIIAQVKNGDFINLCREKYTNKVEPVAGFTIKPEDGGLSFSLNRKTIFFLRDQLLKGQVGLFSQQNEDAIFQHMSILDYDPKVALTGPETPEEVPPDFNMPVVSPAGNTQHLPTNDTEQNPLIGYLKIKPPSSKTQVEFNEVFSVPLDSFYNSLNELVHADKSNTESTIIKKTTLLDQRPRRWYKALRSIENDLDFLEKELKRKKLLAEKAEKYLDEELLKETLDDARVLELEQANDKRNQAISEWHRRIERKLDEKTTLVREIKTNDYRIEKANENSDLYKAGHRFTLSKAVPKGRGFTPVPIDESIDLSKDSNWDKIQSKLNKALFDKGAIKEYAKSIYNADADQLKSLTGNIALQARLEELGKKAVEIKNKIDSGGANIGTHDVEINAWKDDIALLEELKGQMRDFNASDYPTTEKSNTRSAVGHEDTLKLSNWLSGKTRIDDDAEYNKASDQYMVSNFDLVFKYFRSYSGRERNRSLHQLNRLKIFNSAVVRYNYFRSGPVYINNFGIFYPEKNCIRSRYIYLYKINKGPGFFYPQGKKGSTSDTLDIKAFIDYCIDLCKKFIKEYEDKNELLIIQKSKDITELLFVESEINFIKTKALANLREEFLLFWNDVDNENLQDVQFDVVYPEGDPISDFLLEQENALDGKEIVKTYFYTPTEDGYYNQYGQSLRDFITNKQLRQEQNISLFPILEANGDYSGEVIKAVKNPQQSGSKPHLPVIKFIETYEIEIGWQGYGLSELSHTINLFPGETKELVVEKKTKITSKTEQSRKEGEETKQHITSSFEDNLQNTFSEQDKTDEKSEDKQKAGTTTAGEDASTETAESSSSFDAKASASGSFWGVKASASVDSKSSKKNTSSASTKRAFSLAQSNEGLRASSQSKDVLKKNVNNSVKKVANDTSKNNKVEFSSVSSEEFQEDVSNKEIIKLENPNMGRTVNYNFFQVQNHFGTSLKLTDVKIVINSGQEIIEGTGIEDMRVFELEEFGKIFANSSKTDHDIVVSSIIARQVFKHYAKFLPGVTTGNGALHLSEGNVVNPELVRVLSYSSEQLENVSDRQELLDKMEGALDSLKAIPFSFKDILIQEETTLSVNAGAYHMEASVGMLPATEEYLEERRDIETDQKLAEVEYLRAKTAAGVFVEPDDNSEQE